MNEEERRQFINNMNQTCAVSIANHTIAFYGEKDNKPVQYGSAVLLEIGFNHFALTAAHVIDVATVHKVPTYVGGAFGGGVGMGLTSELITFSEMPSSGERLDDPVDVAVVTLPDDVSNELVKRGKKFLHLADVDPTDAPIDCRQLDAHIPCRY
jgi:hypothetical protein